MAAISQIPFSLFLSSSISRKPFFFHHHHEQQLSASDCNSRKKHGFICFACSVKQTRVRKKVKSNEELRGEIKELIALAGFPEDHVPSMKELSHHGRNDLANIVRRRGYRFIRELLANSNMEDNKEPVSPDRVNMELSAAGVCEEDDLTGQGERAKDVGEEELSSSRFSSMARHFDRDSDSSREGNVITVLGPWAEEHGGASKDESSRTKALGRQNSLPSLDNGIHLNMDEDSDWGEITASDSEIDSVEINKAVDNELSSSEAPTYGNVSLVLDDTPSCSDKEADNVLVTKYEDANDVGRDAALPGDVYTYEHYSPVLNYSNDADVAAGTSSTLAPEDYISNKGICQNQPMDDVANYRLGNLDHSLDGSDDKDHILGLSSVTSSLEEKTARFIQDGYLDTVDGNENDIPNESPQETEGNREKHDPAEVQLTTSSSEHSYGSQRNASMKSDGNALALEKIIHADQVGSSDRNNGLRNENADTDKELHDETRRRENQIEIDRLKFMLHEKELELSRLKEQIEKEKLALSVLQRKAETEVNKAQQLISEKDAELQAAEESLSELQEVEIEYCGDGSAVEVTGSFNGWQHRVEMELQPSKSIGKQKYWSTLLWLYPGKYEIKFIVDGQWRVDPKKESVTKGHITNNLVKVDR
ncbi:PREDICTED: uncharacterized protein LOC104826916 isoform X2 [Tarenaya hassleriana]|uniref:uncharacterized protein LOC104826916 isoform X2 n=1 Tax=Tarenaya hassleriana TaxID=28532 RepID=UPI00053C5452|nr:PREDICTED: uncharacterized protein LOC104826916 isoform X2 [Tarenaya hassleriana]